MVQRVVVCLVAAASIALAGAAQAQSSTSSESAEQNVRQSRQYEQLLCTNPAFRAKRIAQECGPISDPQLHESCLASFQCSHETKAKDWRKPPPSETIR